MPFPYSAAAQPTPVSFACQLLLGLLLVLPGQVRAQAPNWAEATCSLAQGNSSSTATAIATDDRGNVFVTGFFMGQMAFGNTILTSHGSFDLFVAKYVPATGTWAWAQGGGGVYEDTGQGIAVSGNSVYVTGFISNTAGNASGVLFGGGGTTAGTTSVRGASGTSGRDVVLAKYTDNGTSATLGWTQVGGGTNQDAGVGVAVSGQNVVVVGSVWPSATFGGYIIAAPVGHQAAALARLVDTNLTPLPVRGAAQSSAAALYPNPAHAGASSLTGAVPGTAVTVFDALGRRVASSTADAMGRAALILPAGLPTGVYVVRVGIKVLRLAVE